LLDVVLPTIDGFEICKHVKANSKDTTVIMLTGRSDQADRVKGSLAGCDAYMVKPVGRNTFQSVVSNYLTPDDSVSIAQA
jgi:twitching motility two-component system response regulator PilG